MKRFRDTEYFVSENGNIFRNGKQRKISSTKKGYLFVGLSINGKLYSHFINRMVEECYLPNPNNLPEVDHLDMNKSNNSVVNLEWVTTR